MRYWWVNQNQTFRAEVRGSFMWSPKQNANGARNQFYENMREVSPDRGRRRSGVTLLPPRMHLLTDLGDERRKQLVVRRGAEGLVRREPSLRWNQRSVRRPWEIRV